MEFRYYVSLDRYPIYHQPFFHRIYSILMGDREMHLALLHIKVYSCRKGFYGYLATNLQICSITGIKANVCHSAQSQKAKLAKLMRYLRGVEVNAS